MRTTKAVSRAERVEQDRHVPVPVDPVTDALKSYEGLDEFQHEVIDHAVAYVNGECHTNGYENFWALLKRTLGGTYVSVEPVLVQREMECGRSPLASIARA